MKPYDTTTARMAGNIAAGLISKINFLTPTEEQHIVETSVRIAQAIVARLTVPPA